MLVLVSVLMLMLVIVYEKGLTTEVWLFDANVCDCVFCFCVIMVVIVIAIVQRCRRM